MRRVTSLCRADAKAPDTPSETGLLRLLAQEIYASGPMAGSGRGALRAAPYASGPMVGSVRGAQRAAPYASEAKLRVMDGSTGIPGPVVVDTVTFFR